MCFFQVPRDRLCASVITEICEGKKTVYEMETRADGEVRDDGKIK
jgi:hypothetical protein